MDNKDKENINVYLQINHLNGMIFIAWLHFVFVVVVVVVAGCIVGWTQRAFLFGHSIYGTYSLLPYTLLVGFPPYTEYKKRDPCNQQSIKHNIRSIVEGRRLLLSISSTKMYYCPQASDYSTHTNDSQMSENIRQENIKIKIKWYLPLPGFI